MKAVIEAKKGDDLSLPKGYKKTKIGWIPEDWGEYRLGEICPVFKSGEGITSKDITEVGEYKVFGGNGLRGYTKNYTHEGDFLLIGRQGALCGNIVRISGKNYVSEHAIAVQTDENNDIYYLAYNLEHLNLNRQSESSAQPGLAVNKLLRHKVYLPPLPEQQKIAEILSTWDKAIEQNQNLIEQLKLRKKGLMQQLLTGKTRLKGFSGEWKELKLGKYFSQRNEINHNELQLLSVGINGVYPQDESIKKDTSNSDKSKYKRICVGDIGYNTMRMWQGRSALSSLEGIVSPAYTIITPKTNADSLFFSYLFQLDYVVHRFYRYSQGLVSDTWQCRYKDFSMVKVDCPPSIEEQKAIANVLTTADNQIKTQENYLAQLQAQKKGLMQQLLTGQKRVTF